MQQQVQNLALSDTEEQKKQKKNVLCDCWGLRPLCTGLGPMIESASAVRGTCVRTPHLHISNLIKRKTRLSNSEVF